MRYNCLKPSKQLQNYIDYFLVLESHDSAHQNQIEVFPTVQMEMTFTFGASNSSKVQHGISDQKMAFDHSINGFSTTKKTYTNEADLGVIMVGFKPGCLQNFVNFHLLDILNDCVDLNELWPKDIPFIETNFRSQNTDNERISTIENLLLSKLIKREKDLLVDGAIHQIIQSKGNVPIHELAKNYFLSQKQFTRRFTNQVGCTPKLFSRIVRFQHILAMIRRPENSLTEVALKGGYFDQAHFIKEFRYFTTENPISFQHHSLQTELGNFFTEYSKMSNFYNSAYW